VVPVVCDAAARAGRPRDIRADVPLRAGVDSSLSVPDGIEAAVRRALSRPPRLGATRLVAVDGPSGSGKTTLAGPLARSLADAIVGEVVRPERSPGARTAGADGVSPAIASYSDRAGGGAGRRVTVVSTDLLATWEHPLDWWPTLEEHLLGPLAAGTTAALSVVAWVSGNPRRGGVITVPPVDVLVLEGVSSGRREVADRLSALIWIEIADRAARLERAVARDGEPMRRFLARWQADEDAHFAADATRARADVVISPDDARVV
jgi:uridine kinase